MLRVTPLYGSKYDVHGQSEEPVSTLIEFAGRRILVNVGWNTTFDFDSTDALPDHDCLLLTDSTLRSIGSLPSYYNASRRRRRRLHQSQESASTGTTAAGGRILATFPTVKMGQMTLYDQHSALATDGGTPPFTLDDLDDVFAAVEAIKYSQTIVIGGGGGGDRHASSSSTNNSSSSSSSVAITAYRAGHVVGGAFYKLKCLQDDTVILVADNVYNISKEQHLDNTTLLKHSNPNVLITRPGGPAFRPLRTLKQLYEKGHGSSSSGAGALTESILSVLRRDGNVLLPVDCSGRVLELLVLLDKYWEKQRLSATYNLIWVAPMGANVLDFARSQLEWMSAQKMGAPFDSDQGHPLKLPCVRICANTAELEALLQAQGTPCNPSCILASGLTLEGGPSRDVFVKLADNADNAIIFTDSSQCYLREITGTQATMKKRLMDTIVAEGGSAAATVVATTEDDEAVEGDLVGESLTGDPSPWTVAAQLLRAWAQAQAAGSEMDDSINVDVSVPVRTPLTGAELKEFLASEEAKQKARQRENEKKAMLAQVELAKGQLHLGEDDAAATKRQADAVAAAAQQPKANKSRPRKKGRFDSNLFLKYSKPLHMIQEIRELPAGIGQDIRDEGFGIGVESSNREIIEDDYGISVKPEKFSDIFVVSGIDAANLADNNYTRKKRGGGGGGVAGPSSSSSSSARVVSEDEDAEEMNEDEMEAFDLSEGRGIIRGRNGRPPSKVSAVTRKIAVLAEISYVPGLEGRVSARNAELSVQALQPGKLVVLGGVRSGDDSNGEIDEVTQFAEKAKGYTTGSNSVLTPSNGEVAEISVGHAAFSARLVDVPFEDRQADPIEYVETKLGDCSVGIINNVATGEMSAVDGSLVLAPTTSRKKCSTIHLSDGEVLLPELRTELIATAGMKAEFKAGAGYSQLLVNNRILVRKEGARFLVEGPLCEDFYTVRSILAGQFLAL